jgi:hypothetical protein
MVEMLPKRDQSGTLFPRWGRNLSIRVIQAIPIGIGAALLLLAASPEMQLESAIHREIVMGDLIGAMEQYKTILAEPGRSRDVAAWALFHMGQCQERLGQRPAARAAYSRLVEEYGDQPEVVSQARRVLAGWDSPLPGPQNLKFDQGAVGKVPAGWTVPSLPKDADYMAELRRRGCRGSNGCAVVLVPANAPTPVASLIQSFSAAAYRGQTVRFRAWLKVEAFDSDGRAQMLLSVDRANRQAGFFDNMSERPIRSAEWTRCELEGKVDRDATFINFGVIAVGLLTRVWVDDVTFEIVN